MVLQILTILSDLNKFRPGDIQFKMLLTLSTLTTTAVAFYVGSKTLQTNRKKQKTPLVELLQRKTSPSSPLNDKSNLFSLAAAKRADLKEFYDQKMTLFFNDLRGQQIQEISSATENVTLSDVEKKANRDLAVSVTSLTLATAGILIYQPLSLLSIPGLIYTSSHLFKGVYQSIFEERRVKMVIIDAVILSGMIATGSYFAAGLMMTFFLLSKKLLLKTEDNSKKNLLNIFSVQTDFIYILKNHVEIQIPFDDLSIGDLVVVYAGQVVPIDGTITDGHASIDERMLTGESQPVEKSQGDTALASTIVISGRICIQVEKAGQETLAAQIGDILNHTTDFKNTMQWQWMETIDKTALPALVASVLILPILGPISAVSMLLAINFGYSMKVIAPITLLSFLNLASQKANLIKDGRVLELLNRVDTIVFDKTGTLTHEQPTLLQIFVLDGYCEDKLLTYAASAEYKQTHPIALAILQEAHQRGLVLLEVDSTQYEIGYGIKIKIDNSVIRVGSLRFMELENIAIPTEVRVIQKDSHEQGNSLVCVAIDEQIGGAIELKPTIRPEAHRVIKNLQERKFSIHIISGDHEKPTKRLAEELGIEHYFAETLPENKANLIEKLQEEGRFVCFVGDGINDSIALKQANVSVSLRGASRAATDTAEIILMDESLNQLEELFNIAQDFEINMKNSFFITSIPTCITIGGVLFFHFGIITSVIMHYAGLGLGIGNAMRPLWQEEIPEPVEHRARTGRISNK